MKYETNTEGTSDENQKLCAESDLTTMYAHCMISVYDIISYQRYGCVVVVSDRKNV